PVTQFPLPAKGGVDLRFFPIFIRDILYILQPDSSNTVPPKEEMTEMARRWQAMLETLAIEPYPIAPVRTNPERTYNPIDDTPRAGGGHVPMVLATIKFTDVDKWEQIRRWLKVFGQESGLFRQIGVKTLGKSESDPFQIMVTIAGPPSNMVDVGY